MNAQNKTNKTTKQTKTANSADFFPHVTLADCTLRNFPKQLTITHYQQAEADFISTISGSADVVAIYKIGEVSAPGFSDLDFIVVLRDAPLHIPDFEQRTRAVLARQADVIIHYPHVLPEQLFPSLPFLFPFFSLKCVYGKNIPLVRLPPADKHMLELVILHDYIDIHWPQEFLRLFLHRQRLQRGGFWSYALNEAARTLNVRLGGTLDIPVRVTLCRLNSLKYPLRMLSSLTKKRYPAAEVFVRRVQALRTSWFQQANPNTKYAELLTLLKESISFCLLLIGETAALLKRCAPTNAPDTFYLNKDHAVVYVDRWGVRSIPASIALYKKTSEIISILPKSFLPQKKVTMDILHGNSPDAVHRAFSSLDSNYLRLAIHRATLFKQQVDFLNKNKLSFKPIMRYDVLRSRQLRRAYATISYALRHRHLRGRF
ncbi:MAG: hypothetical protein Q7R76_06500 [Candidatus Woesearchaeota archaeon]|nr:hypothetical protein [Candidatus Woesearchaeota archaeon]